MRTALYQQEPDRRSRAASRAAWRTGRPHRVARTLTAAGLLAAGLVTAAAPAPAAATAAAGATAAPPPPRWIHIAAGWDFTCGIREGNTLWCWGDDTAGDVGIGHTNQQNLPRRVAVPARTGWSLVAAGGVHTCATRTGHALWCWGWNRYGQLGLGSTANQFLPQQVTA